MLVICGPTGSGKTALALALAGECDLLVVSADSRQIYRGFDIGTAKPSVADQACVPHACLDVVEPTARYTAYAWAAEAERGSAAAREARRLPVVVGGAGFYVRALVHPVTPDSPHGRENVAARYLVVDPGPALKDRIVQRAEQMMRTGWAEEVEQLMWRVPPDAPAWQASGYAAVRAYVRGEASRATALEQVVIATRQYAKRQRTWFRHQLPPAGLVRLNPDDADAVRTVAEWIRRPSSAQADTR